MSTLSTAEGALVGTAITFIAPPPGFEPNLDFELLPVPDAAGLYTLLASTSGQHGEGSTAEARRVFLLDAGIYLPDYSPTLSTVQSESLELVSGDDARVFVVANPAESGTTVNLLAPIVVNSTTNKAAQFILEDRDWPLQAPLGA